METRSCQNCKNDFTIDKEDFNFYEKIEVPAPTWCSDCRAQLRLSFRNERCFYKRDCDNCKESKVSMYSPNKPYSVWCYNCWFSDNWDAVDYGLDYNPNKPFFEQLEELIQKVPKVGLVYIRSSNSFYTNISADNKNCYMIIESSNNEDCVNCYWIQNSKNLIDCSFTNKVYFSYEVDDCYDCNNLKWSKGCHSCIDSNFLLDCRNCQNCLGCVNLINQQYCIFNKKHSREEYEKFLKEKRLDTFTGILKMEKEFQDFILQNPRKYAEIVQIKNSTGNYIKNAKNCNYCFHCYDSGDCKYGVHVWRGAKDCMDVDTAGRSAEVIYNSINSGIETAWQISSNLCWSSTFTTYSSYCLNCNNVFGCVGLRKKNFCILNKQYSKEKYEKLKEKIISELTKSKEYGNFFPKQMSCFGYNETPAFEQFPLTKEEALEKGFKWEDTERGTYKKETINWDNFPDSIRDLKNDFDFNKEVFICKICEKNYRIINPEIEFYKAKNIPIPRNCPECRHLKRLKNRGPNKLWHRACMCDKDTHGHIGNCTNEFETSYDPKRPEIVYCEDCYKREIY